MITRERFDEIMDNDEDIFNTKHHRKDHIFAGIEIIKKYLPDADIETAEHDIIYCCDIDKLIEGGITEEDVLQLYNLDWMIDEDSLAHFV